MYNKNGFILDDRAETEYPLWRTEPCMENCKSDVKITMRASVVDVTPDEEGSASSAMMTEDHSSAVTTTPEVTPTFDAALVAAGEKVFKKCAACHQIGEGAKNRSGPQLNAIVGRTMGSADGFKYSRVLKEALEEGRVWDAEALTAFLEKPKSYLKGTKMAFAGLKSEQDIAAIVEYLKLVDE
jgi:cytochrome c